MTFLAAFRAAERLLRSYRYAEQGSELAIDFLALSDKVLDAIDPVINLHIPLLRFGESTVDIGSAVWSKR
jgi:hypothetical protein